MWQLIFYVLAAVWLGVRTEEISIEVAAPE